MAGNDQYYPGVQIVERPFQPSRSSAREVQTYGAFIGKANQGPTTPTDVASWGEFAAVFGTTYTDLHYAVNDFFSNGGRVAYIQRVPGANATKADVDIYANDAPEDPGNPGNVLPGTPALFSFEALNPGAWANQLHVVVYARDSVNKRFDIAIYRIPASVTFDPSKRNSEYLLEQWVDLSLSSTDARYMYDVINAPSATGSSFVRVYGQSYDPATPSVRPYPDVTGSNPLTGGTDGTYSSPTFDEEAAYQAGVTALMQVPGPFIMNLPNITSADTLRFAVNAAATRGDVFVVIDPPQGATPADMQLYVEADLALGTLGSSTPSYAAVYYPWLHLPVVGSSSAGRTTLRPPGGAVIGSYISNDATFGVWKAPAGLGTRIAGAVALERSLIDGDLALLNSKHINAIRSIPGSGIVVMGARTTKRSGLDMYINVRRTVIYLRESLKRATEFSVFANNDERLWTDLRATCASILGDMWQRGGLKGGTAAEAFYVICDATNNPASAVESGTVNIEVGVALSVPAEFIVITIGQFDGGANISTNI